MTALLMHRARLFERLGAHETVPIYLTFNLLIVCLMTNWVEEAVNPCA